MVIKKEKKHHLKELLDYLKMNETEFAASSGINRTKVNHILNGKYMISSQLANKIIEKYPEVSFNWLRYGEGSMFNAEVTKLDANSQNRHLIPFYDDVSTIGGRRDRTANLTSSHSNPTEYIDTGDWFREASAAIRHYCDSMVEYPSGCILTLREVQERQLIIWGRDYVIETSEERITKRVQRGKDNEHITAYSTNIESYPDGRLIHEPIDIAWKDIQKIYRVLGYVVKKGEGTMVYNENSK